MRGPFESEMLDIGNRITQDANDRTLGVKNSVLLHQEPRRIAGAVRQPNRMTSLVFLAENIDQFISMSSGPGFAPDPDNSKYRCWKLSLAGHKRLDEGLID